jgi:hypothetical protein
MKYKVIQYRLFFKVIIDGNEFDVKTQAEVEKLADQHGLKLSQFECVSALHKLDPRSL